LRGDIEYWDEGVNIVVSKTTTAIEYKDANNIGRTRFEKQQEVSVSIAGFEFNNGNLTEMCFARSCVQFFVQSSWRCKTKNGLTRIDLEEYLDHGKEALFFVARQKNNKHYLQVTRYVSETEEHDGTHLSVRQAMMLDQALGKAIGSMQAASDPEDLVTVYG